MIELKIVENFTTTAGPKIKNNYSAVFKFGAFYVMDVLVVTDGLTYDDVVCTLPVTVKQYACRLLTGNNSAALQCNISGNTLKSANICPSGTYGGLIIFSA